jgi:hypothetical protein
MADIMSFVIIRRFGDTTGTIISSFCVVTTTNTLEEQYLIIWKQENQSLN